MVLALNFVSHSCESFLKYRPCKFSLSEYLEKIFFSLLVLNAKTNCPLLSLNFLTQEAPIVVEFCLIIGTCSKKDCWVKSKSSGASTEKFWLDYEAWRWMFWIEIGPAALFFVMLLFIPESPRFLVVRGHDDSARNVLTKLYGSAEAEQKLLEIKQSLSDSFDRPKLSDLKNPSGTVRSIVWIGIGLATFQQLVGINVVFYYGAVLWQAVGFSESDALLINIISGAVSIGACVLTILVIDKIGRKPLLQWGSVGMAITLS